MSIEGNLDALDVWRAQLTRDLFAMAKFLLHFGTVKRGLGSHPSRARVLIIILLYNVPFVEGICVPMKS